MRALALLPLLSLCGCTGLHWVDAAETASTKGRLSAEQAQCINALTWERRPGYCIGGTNTTDDGKVVEGQIDCEAERYDRVMDSTLPFMLRVLREGH